MSIDPTIVVALISLAGIIISAYITRNNLYHELDKKDAVFQEKLEQIDEHLREHNSYAKMFQENIPVIKEQMKYLNDRLDKVEMFEREYHENK